MKLNKTMWLAAVSMAILGASCTGTGFKKTKSGLEYKIFEGKTKGQKLKAGDIAKFEYKITYKDSVIASSYGVVPGYDLVDSVGRPHEFSEVLNQLAVGDSLVTLQSFDSLKAINPMQAPPFMKKGDKLKTTIKILGVFQGREATMADYQKEIDAFRDRELAVIKKYIDKNNIKAELFNGVYVEVTEKGTGAPAAAGKEVAMKYTGSNFEGKAFDSNIDSTKQSMPHDLNPFSFISGQQGAIPGILQGIQAFNKGGKGRIFIPSVMGYGPSGQPPVIAPNENLIFYVEVVDVKDAVMQPMPQMPQPQ